MRNISISDVTMKPSQIPGATPLSFREKIELSKLLDRLSVSVIETGPIVKARIDSLLIKSLSSAIKDSTLAVPVSLLEPDNIAATIAALKEAVHPRLQVVAPVSTVQMEYFCHKKPEAMLTLISERIRGCRAVCEDVELVAEDAGRAEPEFLRQVIDTAIEAGASLITVCDTAGTLLPDAFFQVVSELRALIPAPVRLGVQCSNELYIADACAMAAVRAGADEVKACSCGEFTTSLEKFSHLLRTKGADFDLGCTIRSTELRRTMKQIQWMCQTSRSSTSPFDSGVQDDSDGITLTIHDDMPAVIHAVSGIGYDLSEEDAVRVYDAFVRIASKKDHVSVRELDAIVASAALQVPPTYLVERYVINSGNQITATCQIQLRRGEERLNGLSAGDGPVDAAFLAIEQILGRHYELDDFQIQAVTEGREAMGETVVRLRSNGKLYAGRGISTDIIGASIRAYVAAINKIVYEEESL